jgi:hypothetical protein
LKNEKNKVMYLFINFFLSNKNIILIHSINAALRRSEAKRSAAVGLAPPASLILF